MGYYRFNQRYLASRPALLGWVDALGLGAGEVVVPVARGVALISEIVGIY
jgi:hypothetical protein